MRSMCVLSVSAVVPRRRRSTVRGVAAAATVLMHLSTPWCAAAPATTTADSTLMERIADTTDTSGPRDTVFMPEAETMPDTAGVPAQLQPPPASAPSEGMPIDTPATVPPPARDTSYRFWWKPYWGFGAAWTLGSFPLYSLWEQGLPDSLSQLSDVRSRASLAELDIAPSDSDSVEIEFEIRERPNAYHVGFPLSVLFVPGSRGARRWKLGAELLFMTKSFVSRIEDDSAANSIHIRSSMRFVTLSLGAAVHQAVSGEYFTVAGADLSGFQLGLSLHPLSLIHLTTSVTSGNTDIGLFRSLKRDVTGAFRDMTSRGTGISWYTGFSAIRTLSPSGGLEIGVSYSGRWVGMHYDSGRRITRGDINSKSERPREALAFTAHRLSLSFHLLRGKQPPQADPGTSSAESIDAPEQQHDPETRDVTR